jgi:hypothetical protein
VVGASRRGCKVSLFDSGSRSQCSS